MVLEGAVPDLAAQVLGGAYRVQLEAEGLSALEELLQRLPGVTRVQRAGERAYQLEAQADVRAETAQAVVENGGRLLSLNVELPSLDEIYARYFQKEVQHVYAA
jgi:ABC-2 type transport system ATP-binding protein